MGSTSAPPLNGDLIRRARLDKFMTQPEVCEKCAERGLAISPSAISRIESGDVKRPALRVIPVLAEVLGLDVKDMFEQVAA